MNNLPIYIPGLSKGTADSLYLRLDTSNDPLTGALTLADLSNAIKSGDYPIQMESGVTDSASAIAFDLLSTNDLTTAGSKFLNLKQNGKDLFSVYANTWATGALDADQIWFDFAQPSNGFLSGINIKEPRGISSGVRVWNSDETDYFGIMTFIGGFVTNKDTMQFWLNGGTNKILHGEYSATTKAVFPGDNDVSLGTNTQRWKDLWLNGNIYQDDNDSHFFGTGDDASILYDGTNLVIDPQLNGSGVLSVTNHINIADTKEYQIKGVPILYGSDTLEPFNAGHNNTLGSTGAAVGYSNTSNNVASVAVGIGNTSSGFNSTAVGQGNSADAASSLSVAIGTQNIITAGLASAMGYSNIASGVNAQAIGYVNTATNVSAVAIGNQNNATALGSVAMGFNNDATATNAVAMGANLINSTASSMEFGVGDSAKFRIISTGDLLFLADNQAAVFGEAQDASIFYDNTNLVIDPKLVGSGGVLIKNGAELKFSDIGDSNYVGFKAPALTADQIWTLPVIDGNTGDVMTTDGAGNLSFSSNASEKTWAISQVDGSGSHYIGGFYKFGAAANDFNPTINFGTANVSYAAHFFLVQAAGGAGGTDTVIRVTGTSIDDQGNRVGSDTEDLTVDDVGAAGTYYETTKKWLGQVAIVVVSGPDLLCNYGFCKYWDNNNSDFKVAGIEATWTGGANDTDPDIILRHHKATGWIYNAGATPTPPTGITQMNSDHTPEDQIANGENGAWKRDNLATDISGSTTEGTMIELITTAGSGKTYEIGNILLRIVPQ